MKQNIAFIGGGNMATAIMGGLIHQGLPLANIAVVEPFAAARDKLQTSFGLTAHESPGAFLTHADVVVWAVKPQTFKDAARACVGFTGSALHLSVAAGIRSDNIATWLGSQRVVRAMPNTPALIGKGISALYARPGVSASDQQTATEVMSTTGDLLWVAQEHLLDTVTALSGSGPAYMFYFMEAMTAAGTRMGLPPAQAYQLAVATFIGAGELARSSSESAEVLRQQVTSKGGTTHAAISSMEQDDVKALFIKAMQAACDRAKTMGDEFGGT